MPWWAYSPSPMTLGFWTVLSLWGSTHLPGPRLKNVVLSAFLLGIPVLLFDSLWLCLQTIKFAGLHPESVLRNELSSVINLCLLGCSILVCYGNFTENVELKRRVEDLEYVFMVSAILYIPTMTAWFWLAPSPVWTDWTYAIRFGYDWGTVAESFMISHILFKAIQSVVYWSLWKL